MRKSSKKAETKTVEFVDQHSTTASAELPVAEAEALVGKAPKKSKRVTKANAGGETREQFIAARSVHYAGAATKVMVKNLMDVNPKVGLPATQDTELTSKLIENYLGRLWDSTHGVTYKQPVQSEPANDKENEDMAAKKASAKKAAKPEAKKGRPSANADGKIKVLAKENPKRKGSEAYKRFAKYVTGMTVAEALKKGVTSADIAYDKKHGFISVS